MSTDNRKISNQAGKSNDTGTDGKSTGDTPPNFFSLPELGGTSSASNLPNIPVVSLPKGGGAISGLGEKFDVDQTTGTGSVTIPLQVSQARSGLQPQLSLNYNSGVGNGEFGLGWRLQGLSSITRKTSKGLPQYDDRQTGSEVNSDVFLISDAEDLVPVLKRTSSGDVVIDSSGNPVVDDNIYQNYVIRKYVPRVMQAFARIERWTNLADPDDVHWRAITPINQTKVFGKDNNSRIFDPTSSPTSPSRIYSWLLCEEYDVYGNAILYVYKSEDSKNVPIAANEANRTDITRSANRYLKTIRYGNTTPNRDVTTWNAFSPSQLADNVWRFALTLDYGEHDLASPTPTETQPWLCRLDPFSRHQSGFEIRTYRLCQRFLMFHSFAELGSDPLLVSSMDLSYQQEATLTMLQNVQGSGYSLDPVTKATIKKFLPPLEFSYQSFSLENLTVEVVDENSVQNLPIGIDQTNYRWIDLDGEGLSGILSEQNGTWYYKRNTSANNVIRDQPVTGTDDSSTQVSARFSPLVTLLKAPCASLSGNIPTHLGDVKGSGKLDVIQTGPSAWGYYERDTTDPNGWDSFEAFKSFPNVDITSKDTKLVDLSGDGLPDVLICGDRVFTWYPSLGGDGYGEGITVTQPNGEEEGPVCLFADAEQTLYLTDMSGDGLSDIVRIRNSDICYWPNCGYGKFGTMVQMDNAPIFDHSDTFKDARIRLADIDGSGTTDILYLSSCGIEIYLNQAGNSFSDRNRLDSVFAIDDTAFVNTLDLLGNGTTCIVWSSALPTMSSQPLKYIDLAKGKKPYLLKKIVNNLGLEKHLHYAPSTRFYLDDEEAGNPWITNLPFPVHCVERVELLDQVSKCKFVQRYRYHHGYFDGVEREFRGFARTDMWDTDTFAAMKLTTSANIDASWHVTPVRTTTWFHTGVFFDENTWSQHLAHEYFNVSASGSATGQSGSLLPDTVPPASLATDSIRECYRALKGHLIRKEVYGEDGSNQASIPYSIQELNYTINVVQPVQDSHEHSVYSVFPRETISYQMERNPDDPRIEHSLALELDAYGNVKKSMKVAYGRRSGQSSLTGNDKAKQETTLFLYAESDTTSLLDMQTDYRTPVPYESRIYQASGFKPGSGGSQFLYADFAGQSGDFGPLNSMIEIPFEAKNDPNILQKRIIQRSRDLFRTDDLSGMLPSGQTGTLAIQRSNYRLCFTSGLLSGTFTRQGTPLISDVNGVLGGAGIGNTKFGYVDLDKNGSWWKPSGQVFFSAIANATAQTELAEARANFFQPRSFVDQFSNPTTVTYDSYSMFPVQIVNPVGNVITTTMDYRVLKNRTMTSPNGNQIQVAFDALGAVVGMANMGKPGSNEGDSLDGFKADLTDSELAAFFAQPKSISSFSLLGNATSRTIYNYDRFQNELKPAFTVTIARVNHSQPAAQADTQSQIAFSYSDGFGRVIQSKVQAKSGPLTEGGTSVPARWISDGWTVFNNKGDPVRKYQPYFDDTHDFKFDMRVGSATITLYDAVNRAIGMIMPDHTYSKTVFDDWSQTSYSPGDNVLTSDVRTDPDVGHLVHDLPEHEFLPSWYDSRIGGQAGVYAQQAAQKAAVNANTPQISHTDVLHRTVLAIENAGGGVMLPQRTTYDIVGHKIELYDPKNRLVEKSDFDISGKLIHHSSMEAGETWRLLDVTGQVGVSWNSRNFRFRYVRDSSRRPLETWLADQSSSEVMIHQDVYGEIAPSAQAHNLLGVLWKSRDQSGELIQMDFDFKGNLIKSGKSVAKNYKDVLDWSTSVELEPTVYTMAATFDALNRPVMSTSPDSTQIFRIYNESAHIEQIFVNLLGKQQSQDPSTWTPMVTGSDHNANNQVLSTSYGNGVTRKRSYDPLMYRLQQLLSSLPGATGDLQNIRYTFDAVGNIVHVQDQAQQSIFFRNGRVDPSSDYTFDAVNRLIQATGREQLGQTNGQPTNPTPIGPFTSTISDSPTNGNAMGKYTESYQYDTTGNLVLVQHVLNDPNYPGWKRSYNYNEPSQLEPGQMNNRLSNTSVGSTGETYAYDVNGNITSMPHLQMMTWDFYDQLRATSKQIVNTGTPETTYYVYDHDGNRVRKVTEGQSGGNSGSTTPSWIKERIYVGGWEVFHTFSTGNDSPTLERASITIEGQSEKICRIDTRTLGSDNSPQRAIRFELDNYLGSVSLTLDEQARLVSYEEFFPYGGTAYESTTNQNDVPKRYKYSGKEKDDETGLYYYGGRYQAPWLGRWISADPLGTTGGLNSYQFVNSNPIVFHDPDGKMAQAAAVPVLVSMGPVGWVILGGLTAVTLYALYKANERAVDERVEEAGKKLNNLKGRIEDFVKPKPKAPPTPTTPTAPTVPEAPVAPDTPAPPQTVPDTPTAPPETVPDEPIPTTKPTDVPNPRYTRPRDMPKWRAKELIKELLKDLAEELGDPTDEEPWEQHHIYPKEFYWFFKALDIDIDLAKNLVLVPASLHRKLHGPWNTVWRKVILEMVDWDLLEKSGGKIVGFVDPDTKVSLTWGEARARIIARGERWKLMFNIAGFPESPVDYMGVWDMDRKGTNPQSLDDFLKR